MPSDHQATLVAGALYRIVWPEHGNQHRRTVGYVGEFLRWETRHCQLHGDRLGREAVFQKVKASGKRGTLFAIDPARVTIAQEPGSESAKQPTLTEALAAAGFGHRATASTPNTQRREIYRKEDGVVVADLDAHAAWEWLKENGHG